MAGGGGGELPCRFDGMEVNHSGREENHLIICLEGTGAGG